MKQLAIPLIWFTLLGYATSEVVNIAIKRILDGNFEPAVSAELWLFKSTIIFAFMLVPVLLAALRWGIEDEKFMSRTSLVTVGVFTMAGVIAHVIAISMIYQVQARPEDFKATAVTVESFFFFRWALGGCVIGTGLVTLWVLLTQKPQNPQEPVKA